MAASFVEDGWKHPALALTHALSSDVYPDLFDGFFTHPVFERWYQGGVEWQLHCVGGPGTGKVGQIVTTDQASEQPLAELT
jgi:hypothetical protein